METPAFSVDSLSLWPRHGRIGPDAIIGGLIMARNIQPEANRLRAGSMKTAVGHLGSAIFWLVVAIVFPVRIIPQLLPELAGSVDWLPVVFYGLAIWNFIRFARGLRGLTGGVRRSVNGPARKEGGRSTAETPVVADRRPTVQRMR
jgi:hypothetical protein